MSPLDAQSPHDFEIHSMERERPPVVSPGHSNLAAAAPSDAVVRNYQSDRIIEQGAA